MTEPETESLSWKTVKALRKTYEEAKEKGQDIVVFKGVMLPVNYAEQVLKYWESHFLFSDKSN